MLAPKTIRILEEKIGSKILDIASSNILSDISPQARKTKENMNKWDYIKLKLFCTAKNIINKIKRQPTEWENIFTNTSDKGLISKIHKVLKMLRPKKIKLLNLGPGMCLAPLQDAIREQHEYSTSNFHHYILLKLVKN